jgi:hypothetical protein
VRKCRKQSTNRCGGRRGRRQEILECRLGLWDLGDRLDRGVSFLASIVVPPRVLSINIHSGEEQLFQLRQFGTLAISCSTLETKDLSAKRVTAKKRGDLLLALGGTP